MPTLRVLSFNVNGIRTICAASGGLQALLESLKADIICFQEHKLKRDDLEAPLALVPGWESFFAFNRSTNKGYSGVVTYVRRSVGMPVHAEEGLTGMLALDRSIPKARAPEVLGPPWQHYPADVLESIDAEGRCVITDHGAFVLLNIYAPAITSEERAQERMAYKRNFCEALEVRLRKYLESGRKVLLLGDINICPSPADHCSPSFTDERYYTERWDRSWIQRLLGPPVGSGPFTDTFRMFHPGRPEAYTCWSTASGARVNNYGTRIDLVLAADGADMGAGSVSSWVVGGDIMPDFKGSDHCPVWVDLQLPGDLPSAAAPPPTSSRFLFGATTVKQATLHSFFSKVPPAKPAPEVQSLAGHDRHPAAAAAAARTWPDSSGKGRVPATAAAAAAAAVAGTWPDSSGKGRVPATAAAAAAAAVAGTWPHSSGKGRVPATAAAAAAAAVAGTWPHSSGESRLPAATAAAAAAAGGTWPHSSGESRLPAATAAAAAAAGGTWPHSSGEGRVPAAAAGAASAWRQDSGQVLPSMEGQPLHQASRPLQVQDPGQATTTTTHSQQQAAAAWQQQDACHTSPVGSFQGQGSRQEVPAAASWQQKELAKAEAGREAVQQQQQKQGEVREAGVSTWQQEDTHMAVAGAWRQQSGRQEAQLQSGQQASVSGMACQQQGEQVGNGRHSPWQQQALPHIVDSSGKPATAAAAGGQQQLGGRDGMQPQAWHQDGCCMPPAAGESSVCQGSMQGVAAATARTTWQQGSDGAAVERAPWQHPQQQQQQGQAQQMWQGEVGHGTAAGWQQQQQQCSQQPDAAAAWHHDGNQVMEAAAPQQQNGPDMAAGPWQQEGHKDQAPRAAAGGQQQQQQEGRCQHAAPQAAGWQETKHISSQNPHASMHAGRHAERQISSHHTGPGQSTPALGGALAAAAMHVTSGVGLVASSSRSQGMKPLGSKPPLGSKKRGAGQQLSMTAFLPKPASAPALQQLQTLLPPQQQKEQQQQQSGTTQHPQQDSMLTQQQYHSTVQEVASSVLHVDKPAARGSGLWVAVHSARTEITMRSEQAEGSMGSLSAIAGPGSQPGNAAACMVTESQSSEAMEGLAGGSSLTRSCSAAGGASTQCSNPANPFQGRGVPRCGHNEPCVSRTVKKKGVNRGRAFYCCARPDGPKPHGRCEYFSWVVARVGETSRLAGGRGPASPGSRHGKSGWQSSQALGRAGDSQGLGRAGDSQALCRAGDSQGSAGSAGTGGHAHGPATMQLGQATKKPRHEM